MNKYQEIIIHQCNLDEMIHEIIQVAACCVAMVESLYPQTGLEEIKI